MPLFVCDKCNCIENSALAPDFWINLCEGKECLCSECGPLRRWHGRFPKKKWDGVQEMHNIINQQ